MTESPDQTSEQPLPFHSFAFTLIEGTRPRTALRLKATEEGLYELHVEKGSAANPTSQFTRKIPIEVAQRFKDALQAIGVFGWDEEYPGGKRDANRRWSASTVFKEGVFSVTSHGGAVPPGFGSLLEELYRLDFPRPTAQAQSSAGAQQPGMPSLGTMLGATGFQGVGGLSAGDLGAYNAAGKLGDLDLFGAQGAGIAGGEGVDFSQFAHLTGADGLPGLDAGALQELLSEAQGNPQALQQRMREEFRHLPPDEQERTLDALAATGTASRAWWERFLRG